MPHVIYAIQADCHAPLGGKARALAALRQADLAIPDWFVLTPEAFTASLTPDQRDALPTAHDDDDFRRLLEHVIPCPAVCQELREALAQLCPRGELLAVRSSASDEDGAQHSFAGQLDSFLFVSPEEVADKVAAVWRSAFSQRILAYRREHGLDPLPRPPAVLVQRMIDAEMAGVAFGADPVSGRRGVAVVAAVYGLGTALVSGDVDADTHHVDRDGGIVQRAVAEKKSAHRPAPGSAEGIRIEEVPPERARQPALTDDQVRAVADLARRAGKHFGRPQDIEWAIESGRLYLLQSRPITSLATLADPEGVLNIWDNSNIAESYNGVTTPLTFSFARRAYEEVYRQFCRMLRVPSSAIERSDEVFRHMLGLIRGRIYYNLLNWYRLLALLPGFTVNRRFMEQMMGVKEGLPESLAAELGQAGWSARLADGFRFLLSLGALVRHHFTLPRDIRRFYERLNGALGSTRPDLAPLRGDELYAHYRDLERQLLTRWDAPLINDFLAMIFHGVLRKLTQKWCDDRDGTLSNDLICAEGGIISAEPARRVRTMARIAAAHPQLTEALCDGSLVEINHLLDQTPEFQAEYRAYLEKFGDRCVEELKLESATLHDDPLLLLRSVGQLAQRLGRGDTPSDERPEADIRRRAEERVRRALRLHPLRRLLFGRVLKHARARVRDRENLRFERTRLFGRVRSLFVELGRKLAAVDVLDDPRDVFYLHIEEALGYVDGTAGGTDYRALTALRKAEFKRYEQMEPPADRFETRGMVYQGNSFRDTKAPSRAEGGDDSRRSGLGCCPGVVRGPVRVITDPRRAVLRMGDILVAERTDPGWIMLFPCAAGLLVERGSLLSHSAIVAREMGIPAIVSVDGVTRWLKDGDWVELNGGTGVVQKIPSEQVGPASGAASDGPAPLAGPTRQESHDGQ
jgi:pyruvate,water dikinase